MTKPELKITFALGSIFALRMLGLFMILPIFSVYAEKLPGATPTLTGLALGIYGLTQACCQLPFGIWSDFTSRKKVIVFGLLIFAAGSLLAALDQNIYCIIIGRALQGSGAIGSAIIALVGDFTSEETRTPAMAIVGVTIGFSFVLAMVLGPVFGDWLSLSGIFLLTACLAAVGLFILWRFVPTIPKKHNDFELSQLKKQLGFVLCEPTLQRLNLSILLIHGILTASFVALPVMLVQQYHFLLDQQWKIYLPIFLLVLFVIASVMRKRDFVKQEKKIFFICILLIVASQAFIAFNLLQGFSTLINLCFELFAFFLGFTFLEALLPSMISKAVSIDFRGSATGVFSSCQFLGIFLGGLWGGVLTQHYHWQGVFIGNGILALLWLLVMLPLYFNEKFV